jgi:hypothetical protein
MRKHLLSLSIVACLLALAFTASAADRDTPERDGRFVSLTAGAAIEAGHMIAVSNGLAYPAADLAGYVVVGRAEATVAAAAKVAVKRGVFRWGNGPAFTAADIGIRCYVNITNGSSSVTSLATSVNKIPAGYIIDVDTSGVWVDTYNDTALISTSVASMAVAGAVTVGTTLGISAGALTDSSVVSADIADLTIVNADINAAAAIAMTKIATNSLGALTLTFRSSMCTNVLNFSAQGVLTNYTANP